MTSKYRRLENNILIIDGIDQPDGACGSALWFYGNKKGRYCGLPRRNKVTRHRIISDHISRGARRVRRAIFSQLTLWTRTKWARATNFNVEWEMTALVICCWRGLIRHDISTLEARKKRKGVTLPDCCNKFRACICPLRSRARNQPGYPRCRLPATYRS